MHRNEPEPPPKKHLLVFPCLGLVSLLALACGGDPPQDPAPAAPPPSPDPPAVELFVDGTASAGLDFVHFSGMSGEFYYSEHMGGGAALFDYDGDGDLDLYLTQGHLLGASKTPEDATFPHPEGTPIDRLYRNDLESAADGSRRLHFTDVTAESGLAVDRYSMGVAVGDLDNDGWPDLYVTHWNAPNQLFRNLGPTAEGGPRFEDITAEAGVGEGRWGIASVFFDFDRDGWLDLYVGNYLDYSFAVHKECVNEIGLRDYCGPISFTPLPDIFFRNLGKGAGGAVRFEDITAAAGVVQDPAPVLGALSGDWNEDGWPDLYLANDEFPNNLLVNQEGKGFVDEALLSGAAMNSQGKAEAGMGVDAGDFDNDGDEDLFIVHLNQETNTLYHNEGGGIFGDRTIETGLASPSFDFTGFGAGFLDYDNDGWLDLFIANGAVQGLRDLMTAGDPFPMHQKNQLFHNRGDGGFEDVSSRAGAVFQLSEVSRGAAFGDLDNDGDTDIVVHNNSGPARLLVNQVGEEKAWLGLRLLGVGGRDMVGAQVELLAPGTRQIRRVRTEGSYASANDPRVLFGLGDAAGPARVRVTWPDGSAETWHDLPTGAYTVLRQGEGK